MSVREVTALVAGAAALAGADQPAVVDEAVENGERVGAVYRPVALRTSLLLAPRLPKMGS